MSSTAPKTFLNDLTSHDDVIVDGNVNGIDISESVFTLSGTQTIDSRLTIIDGGVEAQQDVILSGTVNGIDLSEEAVLIYVNQTITGIPSGGHSEHHPKDILRILSEAISIALCIPFRMYLH